ncbi:MAG TPA: DMT family transporter [Flavobacterium sp.]|jgi:drug/metabolite transporter (DMT)-like permease
MIKSSLLKGVVLVATGAASYGMLATFVKLAYSDKGVTGNVYTPAEVISSQFAIGITLMLIINAFTRFRANNNVSKASKKQVLQLMTAGTSMGMTSIFYYLSVKFIPVSIGIVLLMQTVWMAVILEMFLEKRSPSKMKILAVMIVLAGTVLAANVLNENSELDWRGIVFGILAAASFTATMFTANRVALGISSAQRSLFMLCGGGILVLIFALATQETPYNYDILYKWGILLALFGTVIPPILLNAGFPLTGIGLGSIVSSLELPVSVLMAAFFLREQVLLLQWLGIILIILAVVLMNLPSRSKVEA